MTGKPDFSKHMVNLASQRLGAKVQEVTDDFLRGSQNNAPGL